ncbi:hypothetical protein ACFCV8_13970 [Streptomyces sp. NPDC056347]|uniref:hypothetical protein n=1 Tax=Streptomyces sp. NPDC056347 TaxID=3345790 RepID=UPI0035E1274F
MSERRRAAGRPESGGNATRTAVAAAVLTGLSAVIVSLITGLGASVQGFVTDSLFGEKEPAAASAPPRPGSSARVKVVVMPAGEGGFMVSEKRATSAKDKAVLAGEAPPEAWNPLLRKLGVVSLTANTYKVAVTNASSSPVTVVDIVPVVTRRTKAIDATLITPLGGAEEETVLAELDLDQRYPQLTRNGKPYFSWASQVLRPGKGFVMVVQSRLLGREYVEYHLRVDYLDERGDKHSLQVEDPDPARKVFRLSGRVGDKEYTDYWDTNADGTGHRLYSREERK